MKKYILLLFSLLFLFAFSVNASEIRERAYVQTDKPFYLAGELLWLKMLVTDTDGLPSFLSKVGYVELVDESTAQAQIKVDLSEGVGEGWITIPATLSTGNYRLIAYTRYMQNEGESVFFEKKLPVVNTFSIDRTVDLTADSTLIPFRRDDNGTIIVSPNQRVYTTRSNGELRLSRLPSNLHTLSVSISGYEGLPIVSEIETLNSWSKQTENKNHPSFSGNILPEYEGHIITGKMYNVDTGEAVINERVISTLSFPGKDIRVFNGQLDDDATVSFFTRHIAGTHEIATSTFSPSEITYRVDIHSPFVIHPEKRLPRLRLSQAWNQLLLDRSVGLQVLHSFMADSMSNVLADPGLFQYDLSNRYILDEYTRFTTMEEVVIEFITPLRFRRIAGNRMLTILTEERMGFSVGNSLILIDGVPVTDHENIFNYDPLLVERVDIYKGRYLFGGQYYNGLGAFWTYDNDYPGFTFAPSTQFFDYVGTQPKHLFYSPVYGNNEQSNKRIPDYRHTLLWAPQVETGGGETFTVPFTTSDLPGDYVVTIEGLTEDGKVVYVRELIKVE